jgi:hypothetical protein
MIANGTTVTWKYHSGTKTYQQEGVVVACVPARTSITDVVTKVSDEWSDSKNGFKKSDFSAVSSKDRYLVRVVSSSYAKHSAKYYAPVCSIVSEAVLTANNYETPRVVKVEEYVEEVESSTPNNTETSTRLGSVFGNTKKYICVLEGANGEAVYVRLNNCKLKFMVTGIDIDDVKKNYTEGDNFIRASSVHAAYTFTIDGFKNGSNTSFGLLLGEGWSDKVLDTIASDLNILEFKSSPECFMSLFDGLVSIYNPNLPVYVDYE